MRMNSLNKYLLVLLLTSSVTACQNRESGENTAGNPAEEELFGKGDSGCVYRKSDKTRSSVFPFSVADRIELVYFTDQGRQAVFLREGRFTLPELRQRVRLTETQTDSLFSTLFDYSRKDSNALGTVVDCYGPEHAILFYRGDRPVAFLELCFTCRNFKTSENVYFGEFCREKMDMLETFFTVVNVDFKFDRR